MVLQVLAFKPRLQGWKRAKSEDLAPTSALECRTLEPMGYGQVHASSAHEVRVTLSAITNLLKLWDFRAIMCDRAHCLRSSAHGPALERTAYD